MSRLGDTIHAARMEKGLAPKALAKKCGVAESFIVEVEAGRRIVTDDQAQRILKVLGISNPVSTELEVAAEPPQKRAKPRVLPPANPSPIAPPAPETVSAYRDEPEAPEGAWMDALGALVRRVPVLDEDGKTLEHRVLPVVGGRIEGAPPDKVFYYRCPDDSLRGFRICAGDLLLTVPANALADDAIMVVAVGEERMARKVKKLDGGRVLLQSYDREFEARTLDLRNVQLLGRCVRLECAL